MFSLPRRRVIRLRIHMCWSEEPPWYRSPRSSELKQENRVTAPSAGTVMNYDKRPTDAQRPVDQKDWVSAFFQTADQCNADLTAEWFAEHIDMRFANHPPACSRAEAREGLRQLMSNI